MAHDPAWPDKAMFAAYLLIVGGVLGLAVEGLRSTATVQDDLPAGILESYPHWLSTGLAAVTLALGIACLRTQAAVFGYFGALAGLFSLAYAGLLPLLSAVAVVLLLRSRAEGEETRNDGVILRTDLWPDKAMAASLFMVVAAAATAVQAYAVAAGDSQPLLLSTGAGLAVDAILAVFLLVAAREVYRLRNAWLGEVAALAAALSFAVVVLGPVLGVVILTLMGLARREGEFDPTPAGAPATAADARRARRAGKPAAGRT